MDAIAITLNGTPVSGRPGMTILELAREVGVGIPTLCHDPSLKPAGACRVCLVEEEKSGVLLASCVTPITAGMVINTQSPAVIENRKVIVKLMLASHPESCVVCDKGNRCQLRSIAADLGIGSVNYYRIPQPTETQEINPFIRRDLSKCILCGKCIRADQELVVVGALEYMNRGFEARPATVFHQPLEASECTFCGTCVSMCPTGALTESGKLHLGTIGSRTATICSYCGCGCNILLGVQADHVVSVSPAPGNDLNGKTLCVKGRYGSDYVHHRDRLKRPMIRKNGDLHEVPWDEALDFAAEGLKAAHSRVGPRGMAFLGSSKCTNEDNYLFQKIARAVFGTNNIDNGARLHSGASAAVYPFGTMTNPLRDIEDSDVILVVGANPSASHPIAGYGIKRAAQFKGARLIVIDPKKTDLVSFAAAWVPIRPGMDTVLLNGILKGVLDVQASEKSPPEARGRLLAGLRDSLKTFGPRNVEKRTGCSSPLLQTVVDILVTAKSPAIVYGHGITAQESAREAVHAMVNLALVKESLGRRGGGIYPLDKENNGQGARDMGSLPDRLPGYQALDDEEAVRRFEKAWGRPIPREAGMNAVDMILGAEAGSVRAMYIMGENPLRAFPDAPRIGKALSSLDFLVVQDLFPTETVNLAHVVLPACSFAEKEGTFTNIERRIQRIGKAIEPVHESRPDLEILSRLSERLGYPIAPASPGTLMEEISSLVPIYAGVAAARLDRGGVFWPCRDGETQGEPRLSAEAWGEGRAPAAPPRLPAGKGEAQDGFLLVRGSTVFHFLGGTRSTRSARLGKLDPAASFEMNPEDAHKQGFRAGDTATLVNGKASARMTVRLNESLPKGILYCPYVDQTASALFSLSPDCTGLNSCRVRVEKEA